MGTVRSFVWTKAKQPERPWIHQYHQTLTMKMFLCSKSNPEKDNQTTVYLTFDQALAVIKKVDHLTHGIPKIFYLVGWQFDGHDSKYPAWSEVNHRLKRPEDKTALDSLKWLMAEGFKYNTTVSLHINMQDAYENSPLWKTYVEKSIIGRDDYGGFKKGGRWGGEQCYLIDYTREWDTGYANKRIDGLLAMLPIQKAGTIHIDAFHDWDRKQAATMRKIYRYWRDQGVDVTSEFAFIERCPGEAFVGLQPMAWHLGEFSEQHYMEIPSSLYCGGVDRSERGKLFCTSMHGEDLINKDAESLSGFLCQFCLQTLPWYYVNRHKRLRLVKKENSKELIYSDGLVTRLENDRRAIRHGKIVLQDGNDVCFPALWRKNKELIAYSLEGYQSRKWQMPEDWKDVECVNIYQITLEGLRKLHTTDIKEGTIDLSLEADQAVTIVPADVPCREENFIRRELVFHRYT